MKWIVFLVALFGAVPWIARRAADSPLWRRWIIGLMGLSVFHRININFMSEIYRGDSSGFEVTLLDLMALSLFIAQRIRGAPPATGVRFTWARLLYLGAALLSMTVTSSVLRSSYSVWNIVRMFFAFSVLLVELEDLASVRAALLGLGAGVLSQGVLVLEQRYIIGLTRVVGSQPHPNSLAMLLNLVTPISLAMLLAGQKRRLNAAVVSVGALCVILSLSRGGMLMLALSMSFVIMGSLAKDFKLKKLAVVGSLLAGGLVVLAKALDTILDRFTNAPKQSEEARVLFNLAAKAMAEEHSLGVGINMFSYTLANRGYADRFELAAVDRDGIAHHIYWLTAAELGYIGLVTYLLLLAVVLATAARAALARDIRGDIALGITAGLIVMYIQGTAEWIARQTSMSYGFWMLAAMIGAMRTTSTRKVEAR